MPTKRNKKKATKRLSDRQILRLANEYEATKKQIALLEKEANKNRDSIIEELHRRGTKSLQDEETKVTVVQNEIVQHDLDQMKERFSAAVIRRITKQVIDKDALGAAVQAGKIDADDVAACSYITYSSPYIRVSRGR